MTTKHIDGVSMKRAAEILGTTRPKLFALLHDQKMISSEKVPTSKAAGKFYMDLKRFDNRISGIHRDYCKVMVTGAGLMWLQEQIHPTDSDTEAA